MRRFPVVIFIIIALAAVFTACKDREFSARADLRAIDTMVRHNPERAARMLDSIDGIIGKPSERAAHALLRLEARYRLDSVPSAIDDSLAEAALDRFRADGGNEFYRMKALFLKGYNDVVREDYGEGVVALLEAERLVRKLDEPYWCGHIARAIGNAYMGVLDYNSALTYFEKQDSAFTLYGDSVYIYDGWSYLAFLQDEMGLFDEASANLDKAQAWAYSKGDSALIASNYTGRMFISVHQKDFEKVLLYADSVVMFDPGELVPNSFFVVARALIHTGRKDEVETWLHTRPEWASYSEEDIPETYWIELGDYRRAYEKCNNSAIGTNNMVRKLMQQKLTSAIRGYDESQRQADRNRLERIKWVMCVVSLLLLIIGTAYAALYYRTTNRLHSSMYMVSSLHATIDARDRELDALRQKVDASVADEGAEKRMPKAESVKTPAGQSASRFAELKRLHELFLAGNGNRDDRELFRKMVYETLSDLRGRDNVNKLGREIDQLHDGAFSKFVETYPNLKDEEVALFVYTIFGFPGNVTASLLRISEPNLFNRRTRLRKKIAASDSPYASTFLELCSGNAR